MDDIVIQIEKIEKWFENAYYQQAYEAFLILCKPYPDFDFPAKSIVSRFKDYCIGVEMGNIPLSDQHIRKLEIANSYLMCMKRFKECHLNNCKNSCVYTEEESSLIQNRNRVRKTKLKIEDEYTECGDPKQIGILEKILQEIRGILKQFDNLLKYFSEVNNHE